MKILRKKVALVLLITLSGQVALMHADVSPLAEPVPKLAPTTAVLPTAKNGESPINFSVHEGKVLELDLKDPEFKHYKKAAEFEFHVEEKEGQKESKFNLLKSLPAIVVDGEKYELLQFHFHAPSEHQINGEQFALEAHFVHKNKKGELAVVGVLFSEGKANPALQKLIAFAKAEHGSAKKKTIPFSKLLPLQDTRTFRYHGSLTTPPYTKNVKWLVFKTPMSVSAKQLAAMRELFMVNKHREPQPLNERFVVLDSHSEAAAEAGE